MKQFMDFLWRSGMIALPKGLLTKIAGKISEIRRPKFLVHFLVKQYARAVGVNIDECAQSLDSYESLQLFFTRALKKGVRPIAQASDVFVSPCDGAFGSSGQISGNQLVQLKAKKYTLDALICRKDARFNDGSFMTLYLSPKDYHCFHAPFDLVIRRVAYVAGKLWPVNAMSVRNIDQLFCVNERVVIEAEIKLNGSHTMPFYFIPVGATVVGKMDFDFGDIETISAQGFNEKLQKNPIHYRKGEYLGRFMLGSTIVMCFPKVGFKMDQHIFGKEIKMGQGVGNIC